MPVVPTSQGVHLQIAYMVLIAEYITVTYIEEHEGYLESLCKKAT